MLSRPFPGNWQSCQSSTKTCIPHQSKKKKRQRFMYLFFQNSIKTKDTLIDIKFRYFTIALYCNRKEFDSIFIRKQTWFLRETSLFLQLSSWSRVKKVFLLLFAWVSWSSLLLGKCLCVQYKRSQLQQFIIYYNTDVLNMWKEQERLIIYPRTEGILHFNATPLSVWQRCVNYQWNF